MNLHLPGADVRLIANFLTAREADALFQRLLDELPWEQRDVVVNGTRYPQPRLTSWHGDAGSYTYSGLTLQAGGWTPDLEWVRKKIEKETDILFNSMLANLYRKGRRDSIGMHSDSEPELGGDPVIASLSLGREREFILAPKKGREGKRTVLRLPHGSLLIMGKGTQKNWMHGIEKEAQPSPAARINLTFRNIIGE